MESLRIFHNFKLDNLDEGWIKSVWDAEFVTYDEPPEEYQVFLESDNMRLLLHESYLILKAWVATNCNVCEQQHSEFSWQTLMILNINVRGLLAMLGYIMKSGQGVETNEASRQACLDATSLYLMLLTVPGSIAFQVYHPNLYQRAIESLRISENLYSSTRKSIGGIDVINPDSDDELSNHYDLLPSEKLSLVKKLNSIIFDFITMLKIFRFKEHTDSLDTTIRMLLDITRLEIYVKLYNNNGRSNNETIASLSQNAFKALQELCNTNHGTVALTITLIIQYMLPYLLFCQTNTLPKSATIIHEGTIYFLKNLLKIHKEESSTGILTLMHQLMVKCPERQEGRQKQAAVLIKLLNICNKDIITTAFKDIILFSFSSKISYRLYAQEIVGKLLIEFSFLDNNLNEVTKVKMRRILIAVVLSRCMDRSPLVRGKAMATFALFSDCSNDSDKTILKSILESSTTDKMFLTFDDLNKALSEDTDPLPGLNVLITMLIDRVTDERALVRRSVLKILKNLSVMFPSLISKTIHVIGDRCRDPILIVRQFAVYVLSEMLEQFPHNSELLDEWIQTVVPQIYDIEVKVQEKVLECLESILIHKITSFSVYTADAVSSLPWKILDKLSNARMRKHLSKACNLWVKNGVITKSVISNLQSHIGTENTIGAWILLAALAENMKIPNISRYISDYKEIIPKNDFHASLVLHVLRHTWSVLDRECLEDLYQHLYKCIRHFNINFNLISICLDVLSNVLRYLDADKSNHLLESNMMELMKLSEAEIQDILEESESCSKRALNYMRALFTLGHASLLCTSKISSSTLQILERLLIQWESLPEAIKKIKDLQAFTIILLCQQALRDREIAKQVTPILGNLMQQEVSSNSLVKTAVKINAAKALADICVRFTALVEPYLPDMCISMKDSNPAVREAIVVIFIQLLLEDFIKVKGPFFFHILTMLSDTNNMIRELTIFLVEERLLVKNKTLISQQFLESIYHYNNYRSQNSFCGHKMLDKEKKILTLPGRINQDKRNIIYEFMLEHLDPPAKFQLITKLTKYILREICDDTIDITTEEGACVLRDTIYIISNDRLQITSFVEKHKDDTSELDETMNSSNSPNNNAINVIITTMKRYNLENLLPTLVMLKKKLTALESPLVNDIEKLLCKIYSEYEKEQLLNLINEFPELEKEMDWYQRKLKEKSTVENDDGMSSSSTFITSHQEYNFKRVPKVLLHRLPLSPLGYKISDYNSELPITSPYNTLIKKSSTHVRELLLTASSPEPSFSISTPILTQNLNSEFIDSSICVSKIKRHSRLLYERDISSNSSPRKILKSSMK